MRGVADGQVPARVGQAGQHHEAADPGKARCPQVSRRGKRAPRDDQAIPAIEIGEWHLGIAPCDEDTRLSGWIGSRDSPLQRDVGGVAREEGLPRSNPRIGTLPPLLRELAGSGRRGRGILRVIAASGQLARGRHVDHGFSPYLAARCYAALHVRGRSGL